MSRGINCNNVCQVCNLHGESILHVLRDCAFVQEFWNRICVPYPLVNSFNSVLCDWLKSNCLSNVAHHNATPWNVVFPLAVWNLRKHRNRVMFENTPFNLNLHASCLSQATEYFFCVNKIRVPRHKSIILVKWRKPPVGWHKLNTDCASLRNPGMAGVGGLIRDSAGK